MVLNQKLSKTKKRRRRWNNNNCGWNLTKKSAKYFAAFGKIQKR